MKSENRRYRLTINLLLIGFLLGFMLGIGLIALALVRADGSEVRLVPAALCSLALATLLFKRLKEKRRNPW